MVDDLKLPLYKFRHAGLRDDATFAAAKRGGDAVGLTNVAKA